MVCIGMRWNLLGQMGGTPGVGIKDLPVQPAVQFYLKTQAGWTKRNYIELSNAIKRISFSVTT